MRPIAVPPPLGAAGRTQVRSASSVLSPADAVTGIAFLVFYAALASWLLVRPGTVVALGHNVVFGTDTADRLALLTQPGAPRPLPMLLMHPALFHVWRPLALLLTRLFAHFMSTGAARLRAVELIVLVPMTLGAWSMLQLGRRFEAPRLPLAMLLLVYLGFTVNAVAVMPEHWGISMGLFPVILWLYTGPRTLARTAWLVFSCLLLAATTITNSVFGGAVVLLLVLERRPLRWLVPRVLLAAVITLPIARHLAGTLRYSRNVRSFWNMRLVHQPLAALSAMLFGVVAPAVGPLPRVAPERDHLTLTYMPLTWHGYSWLQAVGGAAWLVLLGVAAWRALSGAQTRSIALLLVGWVLGNLILHNLWGDEFFLYSPHWAWALMALAVLGARRLDGRFVAAAAILTLSAECLTLWQIGSLLHGF